MQWFNNLPLRVKIGLVLTILSLTLFASIYIAFERINDVRNEQKAISEKYFQIQSICSGMQNSLANFRIQQLQSNVSGAIDQNSIIGFRTGLQNGIRVIEEMTANSETFRIPLSQLSRHLDKYFLSLQSASDSTSKFASASFDILYDALHNISTLSTGSMNAEIQQTGNQLTNVLLFFLMYFVFFFFMIWFILTKSNKIVVKPLNALAAVSEQVAVGDISPEIHPENRNDEIGKLFSSFITLLESIKEIARMTGVIAKGDLTVNLTPKSEKDSIVLSLNLMVEQLRFIIADVKESIEVISPAAIKTFGAVSQLSASSNQTATAIGETTITIDEIKTTSEMLSLKAREINSIALKAANISDSGIRSTEDTIHGMQNIGNQMDIISQSIAQLSEQSRAIGDIIASVNDLAEQSNLLAVNAAIEAARAGEQGKTFVIVAQEIKSLAQQSKQATTQVKSVLSDIQNAINAAVVATEKGEKIVSEGTVLSQQTSTSIRSLADTINRFTDISMHTAATTQQQFIAMEQVSIAMDNIKIASSHNAGITKELELAAKNLQSLTEKLKETVAIFRIS